MAEPSKENQERFLREVMNWTRSEGIVLSWFDAFEQPWKNGNEYCSVASHWGIFEANGNIKPGPSRVFRSKYKNFILFEGCLKAPQSLILSLSRASIQSFAVAPGKNSSLAPERRFVSRRC